MVAKTTETKHPHNGSPVSETGGPILVPPPPQPPVPPQQTHPAPDLTPADLAYYDNLAHQIEREDGLINYRLSWMIGIEGFMFTALALVADPLKVSATVYAALTRALPVAGGVLALLGLFGVIAANLAIWRLRRDFANRGNLVGQMPTPFGQGAAYVLGLVPSVIAPIVVLLIWGYLAYYIHA